MILTLVKIIALVLTIQAFFRTNVGNRIGDFLPTPFWIYFLASVGRWLGFFPGASPAYALVSDHLLPAALILMMIGAPVRDLFRMGRRGAAAILLASVTMFVAAIVAFAVLARWLPSDGWMAIGALLGTWIGGSANMIAVQKIVNMPDATLAPLVIVDTILSYAWMALLLAGARFQTVFDRGAATGNSHPERSEGSLASKEKDSSPAAQNDMRFLQRGIVIFLAILSALLIVQPLRWVASALAPLSPVLTKGAWALLLASAAAVLLAMTPLRRVEAWRVSTVGTTLLYCVLVTIGAKADMAAVRAAPIYFALGTLILFLHGIFLFVLGRLGRLPLSYLSTASQAAVGGVVSAPIVATAYRPGLEPVGVLMAVAGAIVGTYAGVLGGAVCKMIEGGLR